MRAKFYSDIFVPLREKKPYYAQMPRAMKIFIIILVQK
jgi:hypothetical protein